ncbi:hypothetical protein MtrunA17_Chr8g0382061 [Medicago truncatula]|uniref:Uncharacterized protein n=1 Tax=Medicago truncatula TaxID=3880 RepID=A0A072TVB2_MEDTR|nr:hypothetical protein MTR_8g090115 [Medicago truncatula]RHN42906.1 hypothetical protein MtrunA17_Chr8g0382061 [Medicago truncatula]
MRLMVAQIASPSFLIRDCDLDQCSAKRSAIEGHVDENNTIERVSCCCGGSDDNDGGGCGCDGDSSRKKLRFVKKLQISRNVRMRVCEIT